MFSLFRNRHRAGTSLAAIVMVMFTLSPPCAVRSLAQPRVGVEFDAAVFVSDNPFLLPGEDVGEDLGTAAVDIAARPYLDWDLDPRTQLEFTGEVGFRQYLQHYGNFVTGFADLQLEHRRNEYLTVSGQLSYDRSLVTDPLSDSIDFADSVDFAIDSTGIHETMEARPTVTWNPNARLTVTGDMGWRKLRYPGSVLLQATDAYDVGARASKRISPVMSVGAQARFTSSQSGDDSDSTVTSFNLVATRQLGANWHGDVQAGVEWSNLNDPGSPDQDSRAQFNGGFSLCHERTRLSACLTGSIRSEVSGFGGLQREKTLGARISNRMSERGTLTGEFDARQAKLPGFADHARILRASGAYDHRLDRNLFFTSSATYMQRQLLGENIDAVVFLIGLSIRGERILTPTRKLKGWA
jgi:hypothetical protein